MGMKGIDVSQWQNSIDWEKVKSAGVKFVLLREGYRQTADKKFFQNVQGCKEAQIPVLGVYHFIYTDGATIQQNAQSTMDNIKKAGLDPSTTMVFADLEYDTWEKNGERCTKERCSKYTEKYLDAMKELGCKKLGIYMNLDYYRNYYTDALKSAYPIWLADYEGGNDYPCVLHQYTSKGAVNGISGNVDMNYLLDSSYLTGMEESKEENETMARTAKAVLDVMRMWIGYNEANGKHKYIIDLYNSVKPLPRGYAVKYTDEWCDATVSAAGIKAGCTDLIGRECGCEEHINIFKRMGIWIEDGTITPKPGDIILYNWNQNYQPNDGYADHVGYVESVSNGQITCIEGNKGEAVARRVLSVGNGNIRGYARPKYDAETGGATPTTPERPSAETPSRTVAWYGVVNTAELNVRTWAGTENANLKSYPTIKQGTKVGVCDTIRDKDGDPWYYVVIDGEQGEKYGFVSAAYITKQTASTPDAPENDGELSKVPQWVGKITASILNVRSWAGTNNPVIKAWPKLAKGNLVDVCDTVTAADGSRWYYIRIDSRIFGFVHSAYITKA